MIDVNIMKQYIGTGLKCTIKGYSTRELIGIQTHVKGYVLILDEYGEFHPNQIKPILHPLSDLVKPIYYKGGRFIPMIALAKISFPKFGQSRMFTIKDSYVDLGHEYTFHFDYKEVSFDCRVGYNGERWDRHCYVPFQNKLFQQMYEWGFDLDDLIGKKEAIDINTINQGVEPLN